jgi:hypothetical protein
MQLKWNPKEDSTLKQLFLDSPKEVLLKELPNRTWWGITGHAQRLGLTRRKANLLLVPEEKFNKWTVISEGQKAKNHNIRDNYWVCRCDCGFITTVRAYYLTKGYSTQCTTCSSLPKEYEEELSVPIWNKIIHGAKVRNLEIDITRDYAYTLFIKQNKKCALSGVDIEFPKTNKEWSQGKRTASLDRIDSSLGYTKNNIQWVHKDINKMKNKFPQDAFIRYCKLVFETNYDIRDF